MSKKPFFSIIIPTLNEEIVLPRLLKDIQHQTFKNFEVTVVDAKSRDKTIKRASTFQNKVPNFKIITAPKKGVGFQRNLGAKHSKAKWLLFFDADIKIPPHFLKSIRKKLESRTPRGAGPTDYFTAWTGPDKKRAQEQIIVAFLNLVIEIAHLIEKPAAFGSMLGCKKTIFEKTGGFDENITFAEDREFTNRLSALGYKFRIFKKPQYIWSLRRQRKNGPLKTVVNQIAINITTTLNGFPTTPQKHYPMKGGSFYTKKKGKGIFDYLKPILDEVVKEPKNRAKVKRLITRFRKKRLPTSLSKTPKTQI